MWVGTGENNNQRSVSYGDGVYSSDDGGRTWRNVGLKLTEHIARIVVDPRDSNVVYVAAPGPLWKGGGERGLYKTTDGGKTWSQSLIKVDDYTGCSDVVMDPKNPDILLAATHQRERSYFGMIHGGPGQRPVAHASMPARRGRRWPAAFPAQGDTGPHRLELRSLESRHGLCAGGSAGRPRRTLPLHRRRRHLGEAQQLRRCRGSITRKVVVDPANSDRVYMMGVNIMVSDDGGRTLSSLPTRYKHVDNHDIWVDPHNNDHYLVGCDGGVYESFDRAAPGSSKPTCPPAQFYDVAVDEDAPVLLRLWRHAGQQQLRLRRRARKSSTGMTNADCFVTMGGDGFYSRVDPKDPNTIYANMPERRHGALRQAHRRARRASSRSRPRTIRRCAGTGTRR